MGLLKLLFIELGLRSGLLLGNALLDVDHFLLGQRAAAHGNQRNDPPMIGRPNLSAMVIQKMAGVEGSVGWGIVVV